MKLPVVRTGCSRRTLLVGVGLGALLAGCRLSLESEVEPGVDGGIDPGPDAATDPDIGVTNCDGGICLDLAHSQNAALAAVNGARVFRFGTRVFVVVRTGATEFVALSAACTHRGTAVRYDGTELVCPNHGSRFTLDGAVTEGPATRPLATFPTMFDETANVVSFVA